MITVYGLKNCDTCRKARKWLEAHGIAHTFVDFRTDGARHEDVVAWCAHVGWETLLNRRGTTWRHLPDAEKDDIHEEMAIALMTAEPALIKRPVFVKGDTVLVGFKEAQKQALLK